MTRHSIVSILAPWLLAALLLASCGETGKKEALGSVNGIEVMLNDPMLEPGKTTWATAFVYDRNQNRLLDVDITWSSSDAEAVTITPLDAMTAQITLHADVVSKSVERIEIIATDPASQKSDQATLTVAGPTTEPPTTGVVRRIRLGPSTGRIPVGAELSFKALALGAEGEPIIGVNFDWQSSDPSVLAVDTSGHARARATGIATVTVTGGGQEAEARLEVTPASEAPAAAAWTPTTPMSYPAIQDLEVAADGAFYLLTTDGRLFTSVTDEPGETGLNWQPVYASNFGGCSALNTHPLEAEVLLAVCNETVLRRSTNGGLYWETVLSHAENLTEPAFHQADADVIHAGSYRSEDGGKTWTGLEVQGTLAIDGRNPARLYDIPDNLKNPLRRSDDGGSTWEAVAIGYPSDTLRCGDSLTWRNLALSTSGKMILVGMQICPEYSAEPYWHGIFTSTDGGETWALVPGSSRLSDRRDEAPYSYDTWRFEPGSDSTLYVMDGGGATLYVSLDGGGAWEPRALPFLLETELYVVPTSPGTLIAMSPHTDSAGALVYDVIRLQDHGATWQDTGVDVTNPQNFRLVFQRGTYFYERGDQTQREGLWFTQDGFATYSRDGLNDGLSGRADANVGAHAVDRDNASRLLLGGVYTEDAGETWERREDALLYLGAIAQAPSLPQRWYFGSEYGDIHLSSDGGKTVAWQGRIPLNGPEQAPTSLVVSHGNPDLLYALSPAGVYRSSDAGASWQWAANGLEQPGSGSELVIDPTDGQTLYLATGRTGVYKTTDGGRSWRPANFGLSDLQVHRLAVGPGGATLYAATPGGDVYRSLDAGGAWEQIDNGLESTRIQDIAADPSDPKVVYLATVGGVYKSRDKGSSWHLASDGLYSPFVNWLELSQDGQRLYLMTEDNGLYRGAPSDESGSGFAIQGLDLDRMALELYGR